MKDVCKEVVALLLANETLVGVLDGEAVYQLLAPESAQFPRIVVAETDREYLAFVDDEPTWERVEIEISMYGSQNVIFTLGSLVHQTLLSQGYRRSNVGEDRYMADSYVYAKTNYYESYVNLEWRDEYGSINWTSGYPCGALDFGHQHRSRL